MREVGCRGLISGGNKLKCAFAPCGTLRWLDHATCDRSLSTGSRSKKSPISLAVRRCCENSIAIVWQSTLKSAICLGDWNWRLGKWIKTIIQMFWAWKVDFRWQLLMLKWLRWVCSSRFDSYFVHANSASIFALLKQKSRLNYTTYAKKIRTLTVLKDVFILSY